MEIMNVNFCTNRSQSHTKSTSRFSDLPIMACVYVGETLLPKGVVCVALTEYRTLKLCFLL